jgi:predicted dehydrogenase
VTAWQPTGERPVRVGLVGLGSMGRNHLRVLGSLTGATLAAVSDPMPEVLNAAVAASGAAGFADARALLDVPGLDAVVIAAPTTAHRPLALAAIERGLAVLVEKPLATNPGEAMEIVLTARHAGVPVQVGHIERFNPAVRELGRLLETGWLSAVYAITSRRAGPFPARIRDVGVTIDLATHDADILSWIARERPVRVTAETAQRIHTGHEDLLFGLLHFPAGTIGMLDVNWLTPVKRRSLVVLGEQGMFELDYLTQRLAFSRVADPGAPTLIGGYAPTFEGDVQELPVQRHEPLAAELEAFVNVVQCGGRPAVDAEDGLWAVAIADALLRAANERRSIDLAGLADRLRVA